MEPKTFDNQIIPEILAAPLIIPVSGKLSCGERSPGLLTTPGGYVHVASAFTLAHIIERCWPGVLRPSPRKNLRTKGVFSSKSTKKVQSEENLCYRAFNKMIGPQKGKLLRDIHPDGRF
jgi:hypothetical protein